MFYKDFYLSMLMLPQCVQISNWMPLIDQRSQQLKLDESIALCDKNVGEPGHGYKKKEIFDWPPTPAFSPKSGFCLFLNELFIHLLVF